MTEWSQCIYTLLCPFTGPVTNHCARNGFGHLWIVEHPNVHITSLQLFTSTLQFIMYVSTDSLLTIEFQHGTANRIQNWRVGKLLHQSRDLCWFSQELCCNVYKGKADEREPSNDGLGHAKRVGNHSNGRSAVYP